MSKSQREGSRATHNLALVVVLGTVAWAHELVLSRVPGHDAAKMGADSVHTIVGEGAVVLNNEVGGITLNIKEEQRTGTKCHYAQFMEANELFTKIMLSTAAITSGQRYSRSFRGYLEALGESPVAGRVGCQPLLGSDILTDGITGNDTATATAGAAR